MFVNLSLYLCVSTGLYKQLSILRDLLSDVRGDPGTVGSLKDAIAGQSGSNTASLLRAQLLACTVTVQQLPLLRHRRSSLLSAKQHVKQVLVAAQVSLCIMYC